MNGILLDTNIIIDWLKGQRHSRIKSDEQRYNTLSAAELIDNFIGADIDIFISCHTIKELLQYPSISPQEEERILTLLPQFCTILETDFEVARIAGIISRLSNEYRQYHVEDCYIASVAIANNLPLFTRNPKDFKYLKDIKEFELMLEIPYEYHTDILE